MLMHMDTTPGTGPGARRRYLGKLLKNLRGQRTVVDVAKATRTSQPTISRIESGRGTILPRHVAKLLEVYEVDERRADQIMRIAEQANERGWWESFSDIIHDSFETFAALEGDAAEIRIYESQFVPGLMQTEGYVRAIRLASHPGATEERLRRSVELRLERQRHVHAQIVAVVDETVLRRLPGEPEVVRGQLARMMERAESGDLQVLPLAVRVHPAMNGAFTLLRFDDTPEMDLVYIDTERGGMYFERPADLIRYGDIFARLRELALSPEASLALMASLSRE